MNEADVLNYVYSTATLLGIPVDDERASRVASHLQRTVAMAAMLDAANLPADAELAEIYCPAACRTIEDGGKLL
jgi:hypothetical protein